MMCKDKRTVRIWAWGALFVVSMVSTIALSTFLAVNIMADRLRDTECTALELITNSPHIKHGAFYEAIKVWERGDGCVNSNGH